MESEGSSQLEHHVQSLWGIELYLPFWYFKNSTKSKMIEWIRETTAQEYGDKYRKTVIGHGQSVWILFQVP